jgi:hypothetical protein
MNGLSCIPRNGEEAATAAFLFLAARLFGTRPKEKPGPVLPGQICLHETDGGGGPVVTMPVDEDGFILTGSSI